MKKTVLSTVLLALVLPVQSVLAEAPAASPHQWEQQAADAPLWSEQEKAGADLEAKYLKQIKDNPDDKAAYANLANLYLLHNKTAKAIPAYQEAIIHDGENPKLFAALSIAYLHQSKFSMAKAMANQAILISPDMEQAKKIQQYIEAKEEVIAQASAPAVAMPSDDIHGSMGGAPHGPASGSPHGSAVGSPHGSTAGSPHGSK